MQCFMCKKEAEVIAPNGDYRHLDCKQCGEYKVAGTAEAMLKSRTINPQKMRERLDKKRLTEKGVPMVMSWDVDRICDHSITIKS